jgi:hypothetical protein
MKRQAKFIHELIRLSVIHELTDDQGRGLFAKSGFLLKPRHTGHETKSASQRL